MSDLAQALVMLSDHPAIKPFAEKPAALPYLLSKLLNPRYKGRVEQVKDRTNNIRGGWIIHPPTPTR